MQNKTFVKKYSICTTIFLVALSGCGSSEPSASDIEEAGRSKGYKIDVVDYKCSAEGERTYRCHIYFKVEGFRFEWDKTWLIRENDDGWVIKEGELL